MGFRVFTPAEVILWATTAIVVIVMALLFATLPQVLGRKRGYLAAFAFYWLAFGIGYPLLVVGPERLSALTGRPVLPAGVGGIAAAAALIVPPLIAGLTVFRRRLSEATPAVLLVSAVVALANGTAEELLWRAAPIATWPDQYLLAVAVPALGFGVWRIAPLIARPSGRPGGPFAFVAASILFGLLWGGVAYVTGSVTLAIASHVATDFLGLGGFAYVDAGERAADG